MLFRSLAHQTTAASATSDTSAWMIAKRRFMARETARVTVAVALTPRLASPSAATLRRFPSVAVLKLTILACLTLMAASPLPAFAQGGGEAPPGGTQTPPPVAPELRVEQPGGKPLIREGQTNRELLGASLLAEHRKSVV